MEKNGSIKANLEVIKVKHCDLKLHPILEKVYAYNDKEAIIELSNSMKEVGQLNPIVANSNYEIISGGRRWMAAGIAEIEILDVIFSDRQNGNEALAIVYHNQSRTKSISEIINEAEILLGLFGKTQGKRNDLIKEFDEVAALKGDRFAKAANIIGNISGSSLRKLFKIVDFEKQSDRHKNFGLINNIINNGLSIDKAHKMSEAFDEVLTADRKVVKLHNDFSNDDVKLYNKSSIDMSELEPNSVQVVFTSPPYFSLRVYGNGSVNAPELGQEATPQEYVQNLSNHLKDVSRVLKKEGSFFLNIGETYRDRQAMLIPSRLVLQLCEKEGWHLVNEIIWAKSNPIPQSNCKKLQSSYEKIFHLVKSPDTYYYEEFRIWNDNSMKIVKGPADRNTISGGRKEVGFMVTRPYSKFKDFMDEQTVTDVIRGHNASLRQQELKKIDNSIDHPALMPDYLPVIPILTTSKPGDVVLDPFSGSGTTGKTALALGRKYVGYELNTNNFDLSVKDLTNSVSKELNVNENFKMAA